MKPLTPYGLMAEKHWRAFFPRMVAELERQGRLHEMLLEAGADRNIKNKNGKIASELCNTHEWASVKERAISRLFTKNRK